MKSPIDPPREFLTKSFSDGKYRVTAKIGRKVVVLMEDSWEKIVLGYNDLLSKFEKILRRLH